MTFFPIFKNPLPMLIIILSFLYSVNLLYYPTINLKSNLIYILTSLTKIIDKMQKRQFKSTI
jgi:hypothetical protein